MSDIKKKASLFLLLAFVCLIQWKLTSRPAKTIQTDAEQSFTLEAETCTCPCGFVPWTDSWCEFHYGT
jgi:hypothetical protein